MSWLLTVRTYEDQSSRNVLVLDHRFYGATRKDALHYSESHAKTDSFYRQSGGAAAARSAIKVRGYTGAEGDFKGIHTRSFARFEKIG